MRQLGGIDAALVYLESASMPMHTGGMMIYDPASAPGGQLRPEQVVELVRARLGRSRSLRSRVVKVPFDLDLPYWVEGEVDLDHHVTHDPLRAPGDWRQLCAQVAAFLERPLDMARPLWELCVIDGLGGVEGVPPGAVAVAMKVHHAVVDGIAGLELLGALHDDSPEPAPEPGREWDVESPSWWGLLGRPLLPGLRLSDGTVSLSVPEALRRPLRLLGVVGGAGIGRLTRGSTDGAESLPAAPVPVSRFNTPLDPRRSVGGVSLDMSRVKAVRAARPGTTVNDVVLSVVGGALRRRLGADGDLPEASLVAVMPMNVRTTDEAGAGGNRFTVSTVTLGTDLDDPLERLAAVHVAAGRNKDVLRAAEGRSVASMAEAVPAGLLGVAGRVLPRVELSGRLRMVNTGVTNVPGPRTATYLCGAELVAMYGFALVVPGCGLMHMATGIGGHLTVGFQAGAAMIPDPAAYEACLREAFDDLVLAATATAGVAP